MRSGFTLWLVAAAFIAVVGVFVGRTIKGGGDPAFPFDTSASAYTSADLPLARSRAGFTGFSETGGIDGSVILAGRVTALTADSLTLDTNSGLRTVRVTGNQKLRLLQPYSGPIAEGATVVVLKKPGTDETQSVLVVLSP